MDGMDSKTKNLFSAVNDNDVEGVNEWLGLGGDINYPEEETFKTPLIIASENGYTNIVDTLLKKRANPNFKSQYGMTALHYASSGGFGEIVKLLIEYGADVNTTNDANSTPLHEASASGKASVVKMLLKSKANPTIEDQEGSTCLDIAQRFENKNCIKLITKVLEKKYGGVHAKNTSHLGKRNLTDENSNVTVGSMNSDLGPLQEEEKVQEGDNTDKLNIKATATKTKRGKKTTTIIHIDQLSPQNSNGYKELVKENKKLKKEVNSIKDLKKQLKTKDRRIKELELEVKEKDKQLQRALRSNKSSFHKSKSNKPPPKKVEKTQKLIAKEEEFEKWLKEEVCFPQYLSLFSKYEYNRMDIVSSMDDDDLKEMGVDKKMHRKLLIKHIEKLNLNEPQHRLNSSVIIHEDN